MSLLLPYLTTPTTLTTLTTLTTPTIIPFPLSSPQQAQCQLLDHFAIAIQFLMGSVVFTSLLVKRHRESPRRPIRIWLYDVSKQGFGASFVHSLNVLASLIAGSDKSAQSNNPCVFYFLNVGIDTTFGVYILYLWLRASHHFTRYLGIHHDLRSGFYGDPPRFIPWLKQTLLFSLCLFMMKVCVTLFIYLFPWIQVLGAIALSPFTDPRAEILFVMLIFPIIMNVVQFWLVDHVIKHKIIPSAPTPTFADEEGLDLFHSHQDIVSTDLSSRLPVGNNDVSFQTDDYMSDTSLLTSPDLLGPPTRPLSPPNITSNFMSRLKFTLMGNSNNIVSNRPTNDIKYVLIDPSSSSSSLPMARTSSSLLRTDLPNAISIDTSCRPEDISLPNSVPTTPLYESTKT